MLIFQISYSLFCVFFAYLNSTWIKEGKKIKHFWNGLIHITASIAAFIFLGWQTSIAILFIARLVFDTSLNLWRGLGIAYVPLSPKSIIDKYEKIVFNGDGVIPKILYLFIIIVLNFI